MAESTDLVCPHCGRDLGNEGALARHESACLRRENLIEALQDLGEELGRTPRARDVRKIHYYQDEFGTWNEALRAAGFNPNEEPIGPFTDEELLDDLRAFADGLGDVPTATQMAEFGPHSLSTYHSRFGRWSDALRAAGLDPRERRGRQVAES